MMTRGEPSVVVRQVGTTKDTCRAKITGTAGAENNKGTYARGLEIGEDYLWMFSALASCSYTKQEDLRTLMLSSP